ncbi:aldehyde dehydrogenase [Tautonia sociabilis]|nr:aldehyde dehydrogenase [Tautonia sociabilis]
MTDATMFVAGRWLAGDQTLEVLNPADEQVIGTIPVASPAQVQQALESA